MSWVSSIANKIRHAKVGRALGNVLPVVAGVASTVATGNPIAGYQTYTTSHNVVEGIRGASSGALHEAYTQEPVSVVAAESVDAIPSNPLVPILLVLGGLYLLSRKG